MTPSAAPHRGRFRGRNSPLARVVHFLGEPELSDEYAVRLAGTVLLAAAAVFFFRRAAIPNLAIALVVTVAVLTLMWAGFHRLGIRALGNWWPGLPRGMATALLLFVLLPPLLPPGLVALLTVLAVVIEGRLRQAAIPLALGGVPAAWLLAWAWAQHAGMNYIAPFDLHPLADPIRLARQFQIDVDPLRLYTGNVPGLLGVTSVTAVAIAFLLLAYARKASWYYVLAFLVPVTAFAVATRQPLTVYVLCGPGLAFAGLVGAEMKRLPRRQAWRVGAGVAAGAATAFLLWRGLGEEAYGLGVVAASAGLSLLQLFGPARSPVSISDWRPAPRGALPGVEVAGPELSGRALQLTSLVVLLPAGWLLVARDSTLPVGTRRALLLLSGLVFLLAGALSVYWMFAWRIPS